MIIDNKLRESNKESILVEEFAKLISGNHFMICEQLLNVWFRENRYFHSTGQHYNEPLKRYIELGLFETIEEVVTHPNGSFSLITTTKITGKGQIYFMDKLKGEQHETHI